VILNQGGINDRYFTPLLKQATILRHNKNEEIALKVKDGTADVWITDNVEALSRHLSVAKLIRKVIDTMIKSSTVVDTEEKHKRAIEIVSRFSSGKRNISKKHDLYLADAYGG